VKESPNAAIRMTASGEQRVQIECGRSKFKLLGLSREEFPAFPSVKFEGDVPASSAKTGGQADLIIPPKALDQIRRLFGGDDEIEIGRSDNHLGFRSTTTQVYTRLIEGPYPNYEQVIPRENDKSLTADKQALAGALRRMSIVASDQTHRIRMAFTNGACKLSVQTPDLGEAQEELAVAYEGDQLEIGFNAAYLLEILKYMPTEEVRMTFKAPERAATCEPVGWDDPASYLTLVMPLRLVD
jgi:DNA polymerase-3 subunit beta